MKKIEANKCAEAEIRIASKTIYNAYTTHILAHAYMNEIAYTRLSS